MVNWEKHYVVGDKKKRKSTNDTAPLPTPKRRKTWKFWLYFSIVCFLSGLILGFEEDYQWDEAKEKLEETLHGEKDYRQVWVRAIEKYDKI